MTEYLYRWQPPFSTTLRKRTKEYTMRMNSCVIMRITKREGHDTLLFLPNQILLYSLSLILDDENLPEFKNKLDKLDEL